LLEKIVIGSLLFRKLLRVCRPLLVLILTLMLSHVAQAAHHPHTGTQRDGDVLIIRHADGTIETRDAVSPTFSNDSGTNASRSRTKRKPASALTKRGTGASTAKHVDYSYKKSNSKVKSSRSSKAVYKAARPKSTIRRNRSAGADDVVIIRNPDGSIEARDAQ
jgi:hypothetical protein